MKELFTKKIYYKKYDHRLAIVVRSSRRADAKRATPEIIEWLLDQKFEGQWRGISTSSYPEGYTWPRSSYKNLYTIFFKDAKVFDYLEGLLGRDCFEEYEKPMDEKHTEMLETEKVITRKNLFYDKYRIAARIPTRRSNTGVQTSHLVDMVGWCKDQFGSAYENKDKYRVHTWNNGTFYFAEPRDAMMFKLVFSEYIGSMDRVVLVSELEAARREEA